MGQEERRFFSFVTSVSKKCSRFGGHKFKLREQCSGTFKIIVDEIIPEDHTDPSDQQSSVSLVKYFRRHAISSGYSCFSGTCSHLLKVENDQGKASMDKCDQPAL